MRPILLALAMAMALQGCAVAACPVEPADPQRPAIEERLREPRVWARYGDLPVGEVFASLARDLGLEPDYENEDLRRACFAHRFPAWDKEKHDFQLPLSSSTLPVYGILYIAAANVESPEEEEDVGWEIRGNRLYVFDEVPPSPLDRMEPDTEEEAKDRERAAENLRARLKSEVTSFRMDGTTLEEVLDYLSARHGFVFLMDDRTRKAAGKAEVNMRLTSVPLENAIDLLFKFAPALQWKVEGYWVAVRRK